jgi:hypothetical protein
MRREAAPGLEFEGALRGLLMLVSVAVICVGLQAGDMLALGLGGFGLAVGVALALATPDRESLRRTRALRRAAARARCARARNP